MSVWIPPQEKSAKEYVRWTTLSMFLIFMLWLVGAFVDEYHRAENDKKLAQAAIAEIEKKNEEIDKKNQSNAKVIVKKKIIVEVPAEEPRPVYVPKPVQEEPATAEPKFPKVSNDSDSLPPAPPPPRPAAMPAPSEQPKICKDWREAAQGRCTPPKKPKYVEKEITVEEPAPKESRIEIDTWLIKVAMNNEASWTAIFKIIFTVLFTFFGIRSINLIFKRLDPKPAQ